jgi:outer membrane lipoprotein-sorting protein
VIRKMQFLRTALLAALLVGAALAADSLAVRAAPAPGLSPADQAEVARVEQYLNSIKTVSARFLQVTSEGNAVQGKFYLERPGKMRIQYDPPNPLLMVASGIWLTVYDPELKQTSYLPITSTPAYFLVKERLDPKDITVTKVERGKDSVRITLHQAGHPDEGRLTLVLGDKPLQLRKWTVHDHDGKTIEVALLDAQFDGKLDPHLFQFVDPSPGGARP